MTRAGALRQKEVININNGKRLGFVGDVEIDFETGKIEAVIVPARAGLLGLIGKSKEYVISWKDISCIGEDILLVNFPK